MLNKHRLFVILVLYGICAWLAYPHYKYYFSNDEVGYLGVAKRLASGEYYNSINGYWSPLISWLSVPLYKAGMDLLMSMRMVAVLAGAGIFITVDRLLKRFNLTENIRTVALWICLPIVLSYVYCDQAVDVLACMLLLMYTCIITENDFFENPRKNLLCGIIGCICYFAKTYALPFFLVHYTAVQVAGYYYSASEYRKKWLVRNLLTGIGAFLLLASPWLYALYHRYGIVTFGYSGKLNYYWHIYGFGANAEKPQLIDPGPYVSLWEDPWYYPWNFQPHPPPSLALMKKQLSVFYKNTWQTATIINIMSFLGMAIIASLGLYVIKKKNPVMTNLLLFVTIFPAGYLLVVIGLRHLYVLGFVLLSTGAFLVSELWRLTAVHKKVQIAGWCVFACSFVYSPYLALRASTTWEKSVWQIADGLKKNGVTGKKITTNNYTSINTTGKVAYLSENKLYQYTGVPGSIEELPALCRQSGIDYFLYFPNNNFETEAFKSSTLYKTAVRQIVLSPGGLIVLQLK